MKSKYLVLGLYVVGAVAFLGGAGLGNGSVPLTDREAAMLFGGDGESSNEDCTAIDECKTDGTACNKITDAATCNDAHWNEKIREGWYCNEVESGGSQNCNDYSELSCRWDYTCGWSDGKCVNTGYTRYKANINCQD